MINIRLITTLENAPEILLRQSKNSDGVWGGCKFYLSDELEEYDWVVVCHNSALDRNRKYKYSPGHLIYVSMESREKFVLSTSKFLKQFDLAIGCDSTLSRSVKKLYRENITTWWVGLHVKIENQRHIITSGRCLDYTILESITFPKKINKISVILSIKSMTDGHRRRHKLVTELLKRPIGKFLDVYGVGYKEIYDKWDVLFNYKYHLVVENDRNEGYWSEKIGDAFLSYAMPIYDGCPNIENYFEIDSFLKINSDNIDECDLLITKLINEEIVYKPESIQKSRMMILNKFNIFETLSRICNNSTGVYVENIIYKNNINFEYIVRKIFNKISSKCRNF